MVVLEASTTTEVAPSLPAVNWVSPLYVAVTEAPGDETDAGKAYEQVAVGGYVELSNAAGQSVSVPLTNFTVPVGNTVGVPPAGHGTVAVKMTF